MSYDFSWHKHHGEMTSFSAKKALAMLQAIYPFKSVLDIGCGDGRWLTECAALGVSDIQGVDGPWTDLANVLIPATAIEIRDLAAPVDLERKFDLAMSLEVAEHVPDSSAALFVDNLVRHSDLVLFGAAIPYQGGYRHINERWPSYWQKLFADHGYRAFDPLRRALWDEANVHYWYKQNMLVYVNAARADLIDAVRSYIDVNRIAELPLDIVHPEKYDAIASYKQIAFKPLFKQLPVQTATKMAGILGGRE